MLVQAQLSDLKQILTFLYKETARNYFIILSLLKDFKSFDEIWMDISNDDIHSGIFKRNSGNLQLALSSTSDLKEIESWIKNNKFSLLISAKSYCEPFVDYLNLVKVGAEISKLEKKDFKVSNYENNILMLKEENLDDVLTLYSKVFQGYPKKEYMADKLASKRGIGYYIPKMKAVAQSDMQCIVVGVATDPAYQRMGYGRRLLICIINEMFKTQERIYLQYDDEKAKALYLSIGFRRIDDVYHYEKRQI